MSSIFENAPTVEQRLWNRRCTMATMATQSKTRHESVFARIRADILSGRLSPGQKLPFAELDATYSVSVGVMREALSRLVEQGLVVMVPQQGFSVVSISETDLMNLTVARREIETLTLRHAMRNGGVAWESELMAAHHRLANESVVDPADPDRLRDEWVTAHSVFHETLLAGCENPRLTTIATQLRAAAELYRRWSVPLSHGHPRDIPAEHKALLEAVLSHDEAAAVGILDSHIETTTRLLLDGS
jgi:DNA-binding GntR family transcriptional regulator